MVKTTRPHKVAFILGIRPDIIRAALILRHLEKHQDVEVTFIWSGQHYSANLKDVFFNELKVRDPDYDLGAHGETDAEVVASVLSHLYQVLEQVKPDVAVFLGDTNTVISSIAAAQLNIPIVHIEGGMRSYDWRMPEEKYRTTIDHLADLIYVYFPQYKEQAVREGINPANIEVVGNPIVDILNEFYFPRRAEFAQRAEAGFLEERGLTTDQYYVMTCHRRENVHNPDSLKNILTLVEAAPYPVYFPASYRTQKVLKEMALPLPDNLQMVDPVGYEELLILMTHSRGVLTDSGTVVEETCVLQVPSVQMRRSTERPQVYDVKSSVKFDPSDITTYPPTTIIRKLESLHGTSWQHTLGDGQSSKRIADNLYQRLKDHRVAGHLPENAHFPIERSYQEDGISI